jgi:hypothetical protein
MATDCSTIRGMNKVVLKTIVLAWAIAGTLDLTDALVFFRLYSGVKPERLLQNIAAGLIGRPAAFSGGMRTVALGLTIHYAIALFWTVLFVLVAQRVVWLVRHPSAAAVLYGGIVFLVMNYVVLPVFHAGTPPTHLSAVLVNGVLALMFPFALSIALVTRHFTPPRFTLH